MVNQSLKNKKIIISAGASGIGLATAKVCLARGATVYLCDIDNKSLHKLNKHPLINKRLFAYLYDASNENQVSDFFEKVKKKTKKIDALINNVGIAGPTGSLEKLKSKDWERTIQVDVNSHFYFTKKAIPLIKKSKNGSIINISSTAGILGFPLRSPYAASKWAIIGVTKTLAMELGKFNIRVNAVCPGTIKGDRMKRVIRDKAKFTKVSTKVIEKDFVSMSSMKQWILTGSLEKLKSKDWERTIQVDVNSHFYFTKKAIPLLKKSKNGSIINISSTAGILGFPLRSPYAASKWAIIGVTKTLAMELGKFNIRVNAVCPGTIKGDRMKRVIRDKAKFTKVSTKVIEKDFVSMSSMKQWILEEDIGKMCSFLISDDSSKVSGQVISVDGHTERND